MLLPQQIQAILYHFMMGWIYGCTFSFLCSLIVSIRISFIKGLLEVAYHIGFTLLAFYGLYQINGGVTNIYLIVFFLLGICIYYRWYLPVFMVLFAWIRHFFRPIQTKFALVKKKILVIIKLIHKRKKRRRKHVRHKENDKADNEEENLEEEATDEEYS